MMILDVALLMLFAVAPAIILHECAHGAVAYLMGDPTAKNEGRLTLNPLKHIDPMGSIIVPGALYLLYVLKVVPSLMLFGWAKPVPVNFRNLKNFRLGMILVAAAGPLTNIILASIFIGIYKAGFFYSMSYVWQWAILTNIALCVFNLMPIPPLDGSRIVTGVLPRSWAIQYNRLEPFGMIIVIILLQLGVLKFLYPYMQLLAQWLGVAL